MYIYTDLEYTVVGISRKQWYPSATKIKTFCVTKQTVLYNFKTVGNPK